METAAKVNTMRKTDFMNGSSHAKSDSQQQEQACSKKSSY
jgi:hypothetical protein